MSNNLDKTRILINKYTDTPSAINDNNFYSGHGEFIISIKENEEGIYIKNEKDEIVKIGELKEDVIINLIEDKLKEKNFHKQQDLTISQYEELVDKGEVQIKDENGDDIIITYDPNTYYMIYEDTIE